MPDTNVDDHLEAAEWLVTSNVQITMIPTELMADKFVTKKHLRKMRKGTKLSRWMARKSSFWRMLWRIFPGAPGFIPWDTFMVSYLIYPEDFQCYQKIPIQLKWMTNNTSSLFRKKYRADKKYFLTASYQFQSSVLGTYCYHITDNHLDKIVSLWLEP
jgi:inosine-uridine nucleoside N-ribohydrolase